MSKAHPYNRRPQLEGKGHLPIAMNYAMGTGGPAGSELGPVLNGVECCLCAKELGKSYLAPNGKPWCGCMTRERYDALMWQDEGKLTKQELAVGWHWCFDWDDLLVGPGMMELESCSCSPPAVVKAREQQAIAEAQC